MAFSVANIEPLAAEANVTDHELVVELVRTPDFCATRVSFDAARVNGPAD